LERLEEKNSLIQRLTQRLNTPAVGIKTVLNDSRDLEEFWSWRPVKLTGTWDLDRNIILEARTHQGKPGVHVVTPFHLDFGPTVLVNRGWFPEESRNADFLKNLPKGLVKLSGILRVREKRGAFSPENHPEKEEWHTLDVPEISRHLRLALAVPFFVVASEKIGEGEPSLAVPNLPNNHLSYAISCAQAGKYFDYIQDEDKVFFKKSGKKFKNGLFYLQRFDKQKRLTTITYHEHLSEERIERLQEAFPYADVRLDDQFIKLRPVFPDELGLIFLEEVDFNDRSDVFLPTGYKTKEHPEDVLTGDWLLKKYYDQRLEITTALLFGRDSTPIHRILSEGRSNNTVKATLGSAINTLRASENGMKRFANVVSKRNPEIADIIREIEETLEEEAGRS
ncbi:Cytochrome oxidase assembly protein shy1, partial [Stylophora pistillata]